jgi:hypothetical protein
MHLIDPKVKSYESEEQFSTKKASKVHMVYSTMVSLLAHGYNAWGSSPCTRFAQRRPLNPYLLECPLAKRAWEAFYHIWQKWVGPNDITLS